ncbi:hypothetical protein HMPREF1705_04683 [Acetomicrobium hydrogeniformans ATCC BAA-1850]|uniref:Uncharacterized protein n=1 Tax=Acetomicrobium hydrogeniformans ATCC BAA-1850 TaxID=592015 RepID=A0A0T5XC14_9BACT|nr:hypothetical protein HMPREF1705_04683 [Acetomicrobium hydrogeniformans ATCC BAA-1850]
MVNIYFADRQGLCAFGGLLKKFPRFLLFPHERGLSSCPFSAFLTRSPFLAGGLRTSFPCLRGSTQVLEANPRLCCQGASGNAAKTRPLGNPHLDSG